MSTLNERIVLAARIAIEGNEFAVNGDYLKAVQNYSQVIESRHIPMSYKYGFYINRALCYIKMDFFYLALLDINNATRNAEFNAKCYFIRSKILKKLNEYELAEKDLQIANKLDPDCEEIQEERTRLRENGKENFIFKEKLCSYDLHDKTYYKIKINFNLVLAQNLPTNIWNYQGIRIENIRPRVTLDKIKMHFSLFGDIKDLKRIHSKMTNIFIYYGNPVTPMFTIAYYQNKIIQELCIKEKNLFKPLRLYFVPTDSQNVLKFSRPKYPMLNSQECYYWRTTSCNLTSRCPKLHIAANKNVDKQLWMKEK